MNSTELMIGDWVFTRGENIQVTLLYDGFISTEHHSDSHDYYFKPIRLTAEILEKNGWINKTSKGWMQKGNFGDSPLMLWHTTDNGTFDKHFTNELEISDLSKDGGFRLKIQCKYVHELQHALRLCGLDELADNFIV